VAEVRVSIGPDGRISHPEWLKGSGNPRWDASVREAVAAMTKMERPPPTNFPPHFVVRFDVQELATAPID
jgi:TonB family protein